MGSGDKSKPLLLFTAQVLPGHTGPMLQIAAEMIGRGYEVVFISSPEFQGKIRQIGAEYVETLGFFSLVGPEFFAEHMQLAPGFPQLIHGQEGAFFRPMPRKAEVLQATLERLRAEQPGRQVIVVEETCSMAVYPFKLGRAPPRGFGSFPRVVAVNVIPLWVRSADVAPFLLALPPDSTDSGRLRNAALNELMKQGPWAPLIEIEHRYLAEAGATVFPDQPQDSWITTKDACFQVCSPELEYPRSDQDPKIKFAGCLPLKPLDPDFKFPEWWTEVTSNADKDIGSKKKIVFVSQGTVAMNLNELVVPTLQALAGREDLLVVATLGARGASLPEGVAVPANARVLDYLPYDAVLAHADVFVSNGGYGGMTHGVVNGVPLVVSGETEDKKEVAMRVEHAGLGVNLRTQAPTADQIRGGVDAVLRDPKYKEAAVRLRKINEGMDTFSIIEKQIIEFTE